MDPIAELLSQLSGVRRATNLGQSHTQLQQLQMQLERHGGSGGVGSTLGGPPNMSSRTPFSDRAPIERVIRRHQQSSSTVGGPLGGHAGSAANGQQLPYVVLMEPQSAGTGFLSGSAANVPMSSSAPSANASNQQSRFLLSRTNESCNSELEQQAAECHKADKSLFVQELLLMTLSGRLSSCEEETTRQEVVSQEPGVTRDHVNDTVSGRSNSLNIPSLNGNDVRLNGGPSSVIDDGDGYHLNITDQANLANIVGNSSVEQNTSSSASQSVSYSDQQSTTPLMVSYSDLYSLELSSSPPHRTATNVNRTSSMTPNQSTGAIRKVPRGSSSAATTTAKN
ncbi:hypothetical protein HDE_14361 [Halotydeus destructor]|nr:hypothetical protein HDE_14361 [Halotydeus destructor]